MTVYRNTRKLAKQDSYYNTVHYDEQLTQEHFTRFTDLEDIDGLTPRSEKYRFNELDLRFTQSQNRSITIHKVNALGVSHILYNIETDSRYIHIDEHNSSAGGLVLIATDGNYGVRVGGIKSTINRAIVNSDRIEKEDWIIEIETVADEDLEGDCEMCMVVGG